MRKPATKLARATWNGPFHGGQLAHPVTVGDALLKLFQTVWRGLILLLVLTAAGLLLFVALELAAPAPLSSRVKGTARIDNKLCESPDYPLFVSFQNLTGRTINALSFQFIVSARGRSSNLALSRDWIDSDIIIEPGKWVGSCYSMPQVAPHGSQPLQIGVEVETVDPAAG